MINLVNRFKNKWPLIIGFSIILSIVLYYVIFNQGVQVFHYDMMEQVIRFILRGYDLIRTPEIEWWDYTHFFGSSIFSYGFYFLFTPFWLLFAVLPDKADIPYVFMYVNMLKLGLLFLTSYIYLSKIRKSQVSIFLGSAILTFSGFTLGYYNYTFFTDTLLFVPIALYFIEVFLENRKFVGFTITIAIMSMINVYLLVLFTPYLFFYTLFRYVVLNDKLTFKTTIIDAFKFILIYILGIGMGSVIFLPNLLLMLSSSRISSLTDMFQTISKLDLYRYITSFLQPIVDRNNFNPLVSKYIVPSYGHSGGAAVYSFIITPLLLPQLLLIKNETKHRGALIIFYLFLILFSLFPNLYFLLQGNNDTRWMVMFIFLNIYTITYLLDRLEEINKPVLLFSFISVCLIIVGTYYFSRFYNLQLEEIYYTIAKRNIVVLLSILCLYTFVLFYFKNQKIIKYILVILIVCESYLSLYNIFFNPISSVSMPASDIPSYQLTNDTIFSELKREDNSVYRVDVLENYGFNNPMSKDYMGFTFYSSVYNFEVDDFIQNNISSAGGWVVTANSGKWQFKEMFGSKYWFDLTGGTNIPFGYEFYKNIPYANQNVDVYINKYPVPLMFTQSNTLNYKTWKDLNSLEKMRSLMNQVIIYDSNDTTPEYNNTLVDLGVFENQLVKKFNQVQSNVIAYAVFPRSEEVKMTFLLNGEVIREFYSYEPNYSSVFVQENFDEIIFDVTNLYGVPSEEFINNAYIEYPNKSFNEWYSKLKNGFVNNIKLETNKFSGELNSDSNQWLVTSIAYDKNWKIKVNNQYVNAEKVNGGFLGFQIPQGDLIIQGEYIPQDVFIGLGVSIISILFVILMKNKHWI